MYAEGASRGLRSRGTWLRRTLGGLALPLVTVLATLIGTLILVPASPATAAPRQDDGWTTTQSGPLGPADRDLLVRVRLAGLWEAPAGQMAQDRAASDKVKEVGHHLATDHLALDEQVRLVASRLGVDLPGQPNAEQQGWLTELSSKRGDDFDRTFADRLRAAHGKVFSVVAAVRAGTRNEVIRTFAQTAVTVVMKHMTLLESIGLVNYGALPTAAVGPALASNNLGRSSTGVDQNLVWLVLGIALIAGLVTAARIVRPRQQ